MKNSTNLFRNLICLIAFISITNLLKAQSLTLQLTPTNISCFGFQDGAVDLTVSGGTPPYTYAWSNDANTEDISNLPSGLYIVVVTDANLVTAEAEITLTQPEPIRIELTAYVYPNGAHISQYGACNGNITTVVNGGVSPYSYLWMPGLQTVASPTNLCAGDNVVVITDANGCVTKERAFLKQPERSDWQMSGNANTNPSYHFIGTSDAQDLSFRTNNNEALRITSTGDLKINNLAGQGELPLGIDNNGKVGPINIYAPCGVAATASWASLNPNFMYLCPVTAYLGVGTNVKKNKLDVAGNVAIGTSYAGLLNAPANGLIVQDKVGIGTANPLAELHIESPGTTNTTSALLVRSALGGGKKLFQVFDDGTIEVNQPNSFPTQFNLISSLNTGAAFVANGNSSSIVRGMVVQARNAGTGNIVGISSGAYFSSSTTLLNSIGVSGFSALSGGPPNSSSIGVHGAALTLPIQPYKSIGVYGSGLDATDFNIGGEFHSGFLGWTNYPTYSRGVHATAGDGNTDNIGVTAQVVNWNQNFPATATDYGLYATYQYGNTNNQNWAAYINGNGFITQLWTISDTTYKQNIDTIADAMNIITQLIPRKYEFKSEEYPDMNLPTGLQYGFAAQEIENVLPNLVTDARKPADFDTLGNVMNPARTFKAYNEGSLIPIIIQALKEQQAIIESLQNNMRLSGGNNNSNPNQIDVILATKNTIVLNQNVPNPFKEFTTISYFIPEKTNEAKIIFTDMTGMVIKEVSIKEKGSGQLNVYAQDLSSGIYTYTLVLDGISTDSKKMIKNK